MLKHHLLATLILSLTIPASMGAAEIPNAQQDQAEPPQVSPAPRDLTNEPRGRELDRWSFQAGVAAITDSAIGDLFRGDAQRPSSEARGEIYLLQVSRKLAEFKPELWGQEMKLDLELPLVLGVVNEDGDGSFLQYSGGLTLRWKHFPWNHWLYTNLETGVGLTYSQHVLATERERLSGRERSHLEFYWPLQLMLAHPQHREHQLVLFIHHHSGGGIFHRGGANSVGIGYRYVIGERKARRAGA